jgi:hypothetical protein
MSRAERRHSTDPIVEAIRDVVREEIAPLREGIERRFDGIPQEMNRRFEGAGRQLVALRDEMRDGFIELRHEREATNESYE